MSCSMFTAMTTRGFLPLFREKMVRLEDRRSVVFSVSAAVPAPQQLNTNKENVEIMRNKQTKKDLISQREKIKEDKKRKNLL